MEWIWIVGSVVAAWSMLSIIGNERQRRLDQIEQKAASDAEEAKARAEEIPELS